MSDTIDLQALTVNGLAHRCTQETDLFFRRQGYDPAYCFELFRRAIVQNNQRAHDCLYTQYQPLVAGWVERHPSFPGTGEEVQYFVNRSFEKFWHAVTPAKFERFGDLKALLGYLKMCTASTIIDFSRSQQLAIVDEEPGQEEPAGSAAVGDVMGEAISRVEQEHLWKVIGSRLSSEQERVVIYGSFVLALKPRDIQQQYSSLFADIKEVYRTKQNVLERLRRDPELINLWGETS